MTTVRLMYSKNADMHYALGMEISDPMIWYQDTKGQTHGVFNALEIEHGKHSKVDVAEDQDAITASIKEAGRDVSLVAYVEWLMAQDGAVTKIEVPHDFPAKIYADLQAIGIEIEAVEAPFFSARTFKTQEEIECVRTAQQANEQGFARAREIFEEANIGSDNALIWQGQPLTSEIIQKEMNAAIAQHGGISFNGGPIVAGGSQGADPHERGHGQLYANQFIVIDSFPQHSNGYNGDLTRTFLKGTPTPWHEAVYSSVKKAQQRALDLIKPKADGNAIHKEVQASIEADGFETGKTDAGQWYGFFHGTGHGVGLEVHDFPRGTISSRPWILESGHVTSVEPGLYYAPGLHADGMGGCRIEDIVVVTEGGHDNLTSISKDEWVIS